MNEMDGRLQFAASLVEEAGRVALQHFRNRDNISAQAKAPMDFVSAADTEVEMFIRRRVNDVWPGEALVGEELGGEGGSSFWIVDPIDGTANFLRGSPLWGVALAFVRDGEPCVGAINFPVLGMTLVAGLGCGAYVNGSPLERSVPFPDVRLATICSNRQWSGPEPMTLEAQMKRHEWAVTNYRCATIGLGFAALGYTDGYFERQTSMWDLAAGVVICREVGLEVAFGGEQMKQGMWVGVASPNLKEAIWPFWLAIVS